MGSRLFHLVCFIVSSLLSFGVFADQNFNVVVLGDDWATGRSLDSTDNPYPDILNQKYSTQPPNGFAPIRFIVGDYSRDDQTSEEVIHNIIPGLDNDSLNAVLIEVGQNDFLVNLSKADFDPFIEKNFNNKFQKLASNLNANLSTIVDNFLNNKKYVFFAQMKVPEYVMKIPKLIRNCTAKCYGIDLSHVKVEDYIRQFDSIYAQVCQKYSSNPQFYCLKDFTTDLGFNDFSSDLLYPKSKGHQKIADHVYENLKVLFGKPVSTEDATR